MGRGRFLISLERGYLHEIQMVCKCLTVAADDDSEARTEQVNIVRAGDRVWAKRSSPDIQRLLLALQVSIFIIIL